MGVRGRLLLAFFGISAFAVGAAVAAMVSFFQVRDSLSLITQHRVPSALASLELSRQTERVVAAAPALLTVTTLERYEEESSRIENEVERLNDLLGDVEHAQIEEGGFGHDTARVTDGQDGADLFDRVGDRIADELPINATRTRERAHHE